VYGSKDKEKATVVLKNKTSAKDKKFEKAMRAGKAKDKK
jgi:hypothetical protein